MSEKKMMQVYNPSLASLLLAAETDKGRPLSEPEVVAIRNSATIIMVPEETAREIENKRGHKDINPENCWEEWCELRKRC